MKCIIIAGEWNSSNLGDEIICKTFLRLLKEFSSNYKYIPLDISMRNKNLFENFLYHILCKLNNKLSYRFLCFIRKKNVARYSDILLKNNDVSQVIVPGGALIQHYFAECLQVLVKKCNKYDIPISFNACGIGLNTEKSRTIFQWIFSQPCIRQITTRDTLSSITDKKIAVIPDIAIMAYKYYNFKIEKKQDLIIGINVIAPQYYERCSEDSVRDINFINEKILKLIDIVSETYNISLFSNGDNADDNYANWLCSKIQKKTIKKEPCPINGFELTQIISKFSLVIGFRLHSLITAYSYEIPSIGFAWDKKVAYWGEMTNNEHIFLLSKLPLDINSLIQMKINTGIDKQKKYELEQKIIKQIKSYL